jgi:hypothetical protein
MAARRLLGVAAFALAALVLTSLLGCGGGSPSQHGGEETVAEGALRTALAREGGRFISLVAPSFLEEARREMPGTEDGELGGVLIAGFLEGIPFVEIKNASYQVEVQGDEAVVHVWGVFLDAGGGEVNIPEPQALRIPLIREGGRWYLDLLDL